MDHGRHDRVAAEVRLTCLMAFLGAASGIVAALLVGSPGGPKITPSVSLGQLIGYNLLIVAAILILRVLFTIFKNR